MKPLGLYFMFLINFFDINVFIITYLRRLPWKEKISALRLRFLYFHSEFILGGSGNLIGTTLEGLG